MLKNFENNTDIYHISGCNLFYGLHHKRISGEKYFYQNILNYGAGLLGKKMERVL